MTTSMEVVAAARSWMATPYLHQGRMKRVGVDCAGLVIGVARELGLVEQDFDIQGYPRTPDGVEMIAIGDRFMTRVPLRDLKPGHVVVMRYEIDPQHVGITGDYLHGGLSLVHALGSVDGRGKVVEHRLADSKRATIVQVYALRDVNYETA